MVDSIDPSAFNALTALNALNQVNNLVPNTRESAERGETNSRTDTVRARLSDTSGVRSAREALGNTEAAAAAAVEAAGQIKDVLFEMRAIAIQAKESSLDQSSRDKLEARFDELAAVVDDHVGAAAVNGTNLLARDAADVKLETARSGRGLTERQRESAIDRFAQNRADPGFGEIVQESTTGFIQAVALKGAAPVQEKAADLKTELTEDETTLTVRAQDLTAQGLEIDDIAVDTEAKAEVAEGRLNTAIRTLEAREADLKDSQEALKTEVEDASLVVEALVDDFSGQIEPDLGVEGAKLRAQHISQELGKFSTAIANSDGQSIIGLLNNPPAFADEE